MNNDKLERVSPPKPYQSYQPHDNPTATAPVTDPRPKTAPNSTNIGTTISPAHDLPVLPVAPSTSRLPRPPGT